MENTPMFPGISAPQLTPFYDNGKVNYAEYTRLTRFLVKGGVKGIFVCGTTGEFVNLTIQERKNLLSAAKEGIDTEGKLLFNVTALNLEDTQGLMEWAVSEGADAVSLTPPYYHSYDSQAMLDYFIQLSRLAAPLPVYLYNIPSMTGNVITPEVLKKVCCACGNVRGIKDSSMDFMTFLQFQLAVPEKGFEIMTGNDAQILTALQAGGTGAVIAMAGVFPQLCSGLWDAYINGEIDRAKEIQNKVLKLRDLVRGTLPVMAHKEMLRMQGFSMGRARFPFRNLTREEQKRIEDTVREMELIVS